MPECLIVQPIHEAGVEALRAAGIKPRFASAQDMATVAAEIGGAAAVITRDAGLDATAMEAGHDLQVIVNHGIGSNKIDLARARDLAIPVAYTPTANALSVAEHAMMLMLTCARRGVEADAAARVGSFRFKFEGGMIELTGKTLGIAGFGTIARHLMRIAQGGFGMQVIVWSPSAEPEAIRAAGGAPVETLAALLARADVVSLHRPARPDTKHMINTDTLAQMKSGAILVNTARGALIDEAALAEVLANGPQRAAGLDVFDPEPIEPISPLIGLPNLVLAPHVGGSTEDALRATALACAEHAIAALAGRRPADLINPETWDRRRKPA